MKKILLLFSFFISFYTISLSQTVYVTKTGKKYHKENCTYLRSSSISVNLIQAINKGYGACSVCNPPIQPSSIPQNPRTPPSQGKVPNQIPPSKENRCTAITKVGKQCSRIARSGGLCWQHGG